MQIEIFLLFITITKETFESQEIIEVNDIKLDQTSISNDIGNYDEESSLITKESTANNLTAKPLENPMKKVINTNKPMTLKQKIYINLATIPILFIFDRLSFVFTFSLVMLFFVVCLCSVPVVLSSKRNRYARTMTRLYNGVIFGLNMVFFAKYLLLLSLIMLITNFVFRFKKAKKFVLNKLMKIWINVLFAALEGYFPDPFYVSYDPEILKMNKSIIICNHTSDYDWLFILTLLYKMGKLENVCIMLKQSLQEVPLIGYAMKCLDFIFLVRNIEYDKDIIHEGVMKLKNKDRYDILIFPEGTYIDSKSYKKTLEYLKKNNITIDGESYFPKHSLAPKTTGFKLLLEDLADDIDGVVDITMLVSPYQQYPSEVHTFKHTFLDASRNLNCSLLIDHLPLSDVIKDEDLLFRRFSRKDKIIEKFKTKLNGEQFIDLNDFTVKGKELGVRDDYLSQSMNVESRWKITLYVIFFVFELVQALFFIKMFYG